MDVVGSYKYIGVYMDEFMNFNPAVECLSDSACRALGGIIAKLKNFHNITHDTYNKLFDAGIVPILDYCYVV